MQKQIKNSALRTRSKKILSLFTLLVLAVLFFLLSVTHTIHSDRRLPSYNATVYDRSFRGSIISKDGYTLSNSHKTYQAIIRGASIAPGKKEMFVKLFSIYSGIPVKEIYEKFKDKRGKTIQGNITLSKRINARTAMQLKSLAYKLRKLDTFQWVRNRSGIKVLYGLDIIENGESRRFPLKDVLSPILGYVGDKSDGRYTRPQGKKGLERNYEKHITSQKNGYFKGKRDVAGRIIHDKNSIKIQRVDGLDLHLNVPLAFQRRVELMLDQMKENLNADEILVGVMESKTGKVLSMASSERFDPSHITQKDIPALNPKFAEYPYEAGSVIKPITLAIALDHHVVTPETWFNTYNGRMKIGKRRTITDDDKFDALTAKDIIVHSSNVGISQISWKLTGKEFRDGLLKFGLSKPSGIDLSRDLPGQLKPLYKLNHQMHRANSAYGYGMMETFTQLLKAYSAFNNNGVAVTPRIVDYLEDAKGNRYTLDPSSGNLKAVNKKAANQIHDILVEVVQRGTGVKAQYEGLEIGGKTGTAHIAKNGRYVREYHSSFYGFANDKEGNRYTIGALVIRAKKYRKYFASQSAVPTFRRVVDIMVELDYLKPEDNETKPLAPLVVEKPKPEPEVTPELPDFEPEPAQETPEEEEKIDTSPLKRTTPLPNAKKATVKQLFDLEKRTKKPTVEPVTPEPRPKPVVEREPQSETHPVKVETKPKQESFEDLF